MSRTNWIRETIFVTLALFILVFIFQTSPLLTRLGTAGGLIIPFACLIIPWTIITINKESMTDFGLHLDNFSESLITGLLVSLLLLGPYFLFFSFWFDLHPIEVSGWPRFMRWFKMSLFQLFYVALPEEFFFRGYLQSRLNNRFGTPFRFLGAAFGWGLPAAALVFMAFHLLQAVNIWTVGVLVPALIFGWLRERTGSITAPIIFHALSNILLFAFQGRY